MVTTINIIMTHCGLKDKLHLAPRILHMFSTFVTLYNVKIHTKSGRGFEDCNK